jgi:ABC-type multidrug transport system ATPase subunit
VLETFQLNDLALSRVDRISMGQRQRVRLAMTFLHDPDVVLLDEPLTSLDAPAASLLFEAIGDMRARGGAALWCAPALEGATLEYDSVHEIIDGKLVNA